MWRRMKYARALLAPVLAAVLVAVIDLPASLGAHPFWSDTVILIGLPIGLILAAVLAQTRLTRWQSTAIVALFAGAAYLAATVGKARFAASYAEDGFAGQMWYFGWIATCALLAALIAALLWPRRRAH